MVNFARYGNKTVGYKDVGTKPTNLSVNQLFVQETALPAHMSDIDATEQPKRPSWFLREYARRLFAADTSMLMNITLAHTYRAYAADQEMPQHWLDFAADVCAAASKLREAEGFRQSYPLLYESPEGSRQPWKPV